MTITTEIGQTTPEAITVRGRDLAHDILGKLDFVDAFILCAFARIPTPQEKDMMNVLLVLALDHGLTPSSIAARLTLLGAPDALQGAVAAGLLGAGSRYLGPAMNVARQLADETKGLSGDEEDGVFDARAKALLARPENGRLAGFGHPIHKDGDPRVVPLRKIAMRNGFYGGGWRLLDALERELKRKRNVPVNASGALGATILDMGLPPAFATGIALVGRCAGLVSHLLEEDQQPIAQEVWEHLLRQDSRNILGDEVGQ